MKANFVVSAHSEAWVPDANALLVADPYIVHVLEKTNRLDQFESVRVVPPRRASRDAFQRDHEFVSRKLRKYNQIMVRRLDQVHQTKYGEKFWNKALALALLRHVSLCYDLFQVCELNLDLEQHMFRVLDPLSYMIPRDFDDHRRMFQSTDLGQEQLFSVYCHCFHAGNFTTWEETAYHVDSSQESTTTGTTALWRRIGLKTVARRLARMRQPVLGVMNAYFSADNMDRLFLRSKGRIQNIPLPNVSLSNTELQWDKREELTREEADFDRFDQFVFSALNAGMPYMFVENFGQVYDKLNTHFENYHKLRWIVCEGWIGHTLSSLALAVLGLKNVRHIYNEHNYLAHPFVGNNLKYIMPLIDEFHSLGWKDESNPKIVPGASLFQWVEGAGVEKQHDLMFISSVPNTRSPEINSSYGESGDRVVPGYLDMNRRFFAALKETTLSTIMYRAYPARYTKQALVWDQDYVLREYLEKVKAVDDSTTPARLLMQQSRLVIINYLSTSYLEALQANVPTVFLWNQQAYFLEDRYADFFDALIRVKICHTDPVTAAVFVEEIKNDPESWWTCAEVQQARREFLGTNMGNLDNQMKHLYSRSKQVAENN